MGKFFSDAFSEAGGRCEYCGKGLLDNFDVFSTAVEDHLKPRSADGAIDQNDNIVIACNVCNTLKGQYIPSGKDREEMIVDARQYIFKRRAEKITDFLTWKTKLQ